MAEAQKAVHEHERLSPERMLNVTPEEAVLRLAAIVESSDDAIVSKDLTGIITSWNAAAERLFGYTRDEIVGKSVLTIIPPELHHQEPEILRKLAAGERIEHFETERLRKDGRRVFVSLTISPVKDLTGRVIGASKIARDISERARVEETRFRMAAIVDSSDDAIISKDLNGIITSWNTAAERLFGYKAEEIVGRSVLTIIPPELQHEEAGILQKIRSGEKIEHYETERMRKDGQKVWVSLSISPIKDLFGNAIGASKIARDITENRRMQEALIQSEKLAATGRMAAAIAHEINNPLEAVTNLAYLLSMDPTLNPTARSYAQMMLDEVARASEITKQTLAFYRESGRPGEFNVCDLLDNVIALNRPNLDRRSVTVLKGYDKADAVYGYGSEVRQVFANLLLNALDAIEHGGKVQVRVRMAGESLNGNRHVRITIADNGSGIPAEHRKRLFEPFFTTKENRGNGLGLWVSHGIVTKHGGRMKVRSSTHQGRSGTVFWVELPVRGISAGRNAAAS
jgi:PAS domain S-box-containing protein